ncbi:THO complex subunit 1 [Golovinomyces cichoracearum]|uniref:THO complex subunit 1 n=1 Tax=Golovinomyces cichoracearum TaxID=62708 RepID=A0A420HHW7_9PEZI|nr:THO complex subunit 1 [Golovinomyces cichoracearum]
MLLCETSHGVQAVDRFVKLLHEMLNRAQEIKKTDKVDPALHRTDLLQNFDEIKSIFPSSVSSESKKQIIDAAARTTFNNLLASMTLEHPSFQNIWNLLDIISILSEDEETEPGLLFWLVEELLDSQTIAGCRKVFDYLESRREIITAKHFQAKKLIILRSCNELLRRLSRAEDTAFCGRVFIFLFQSFPLGDKSAVNLRGEYHTENVTTFDNIQFHSSDPDKMQLDSNSVTIRNTHLQKESELRKLKHISDDSANSNLAASFVKETNIMSADQLYPSFWSLQKYFSQPKKLFDRAKFSTFKHSLEATMVMFRSVQTENSSDRSIKSADDSRRCNKRKRGNGDDELANTFNPKYLTSRDLFELEISDLSFRRHILVQCLIILDFLLSLSAKSKEKLAKATIENPNKSVMYSDQLFNSEDTNWATEMKKFIAEYLKQSQDGPFFYRMVETVLSRDKNWSRWKIENCPSIARNAVTPQEFLDAKLSARKVTTNKRLRPNPIGSFDIKFLSENESRRGLRRLKDPTRYSVPSVSSFKNKIQLDDMDIEMASTQEEKRLAIQSKASKSWRAFRIASSSKLIAFDKIERSEKIDNIFQEQLNPEETFNGEDDLVDEEDQIHIKDTRPNVMLDDVSSNLTSG